MSVSFFLPSGALLSFRIGMDQTPSEPTELLEPVNLHLEIKRNLSASWYKQMAAVEIKGDLKPMKVGRGTASGMMPMVVLGERRREWFKDGVYSNGRSEIVILSHA